MVAPMVTPHVAMSDADVTVAFRALLDEVIGDSADKVCLSIAATNGADTDPSSTVMHALSGHGPARLLTHSACADDERNFGNARGLLRLRDVSHVDEHTLMVHADAVGDHTARYECLVPAAANSVQHPHCRITQRDWPGSQARE
jgi:hypothetical protein